MDDDAGWFLFVGVPIFFFFGWGLKSCAVGLDHLSDTSYCEKTCGSRRSRASEEFCFCMNDQNKWQYDSVTGEKK